MIFDLDKEIHDDSKKLLECEPLHMCIDCYVLCFSMVMTRGGAGSLGSGSSLGFDTEPIDEGLM